MTSNQSPKACGRLKLAVKYPLATSNIVKYIIIRQYPVEESRGNCRAEVKFILASIFKAKLVFVVEFLQDMSHLKLLPVES